LENIQDLVKETVAAAVGAEELAGDRQSLKWRGEWETFLKGKIMKVDKFFIFTVLMVVLLLLSACDSDKHDEAELEKTAKTKQEIEALYATDASVVNIYGYAFNYDPLGGSRNGGQLTGFWEGGNPFSIDFLDNIETGSTYYDHVVLIPEPATLLLLGLGAVMLRRIR